MMRVRDKNILFQKIISPILLSRQREKVEAELETFLSLLALELELKQSFEIALTHAATHSPREVRNLILPALARYEKQGMNIHASLQKTNEKIKSREWLRVLALLSHLHAHGTTNEGINGLRSVAKEFRLRQQAQTKAYSSILAMLSLVFIGVSAIVPALFLAFITIGCGFLQLGFSAMDVMLVSLVGFPILDALVLGILWIKTPYFLRANG